MFRADAVQRLCPRVVAAYPISQKKSTKKRLSIRPVELLLRASPVIITSSPSLLPCSSVPKHTVNVTAQIRHHPGPSITIITAVLVRF